MTKKNKAKIKGFIIKYIIGSKFGRLIDRFNNFLLKDWIYRYKFYLWIRDNYSKFKFIDSQPGQEKHYSLSPEIIEERRNNLYKFLLDNEALSGEIDYLEFGVAKGLSFGWWLENNRNPLSRFIGFDVFTGLPERWDRVKTGTFSTGGKIPQFNDSRCSFKVGLFQDTLEPFLKEYPLKRKTVVHLDMDLYTSALFVLTTLGPRLKKGDILIFDEFSSVLHEFRAFLDFVSAYRINYQLLGSANNFAQIAIKLI